MIRNFADKQTEALLAGLRVRTFPPDVARTAQRKLILLAKAKTLDDLRNPPGNRLKPLQGGRSGTYSIRINDQWRVTFHWVDGAAEDVRVEDYH
ncbi:MAG: type II toxin-antitoxin system RelE/ParE family toxin [Sandarakinorhabdus sp.]|jgi:proteic killer suppression protein